MTTREIFPIHHTIDHRDGVRVWANVEKCRIQIQTMGKGIAQTLHTSRVNGAIKAAINQSISLINIPRMHIRLRKIDSTTMNKGFVSNDPGNPKITKTSCGIFVVERFFHATKKTYLLQIQLHIM